MFPPGFEVPLRLGGGGEEHGDHQEPRDRDEDVFGEDSWRAGGGDQGPDGEAKGESGRQGGGNHHHYRREGLEERANVNMALAIHIKHVLYCF